jgi:hypothetical protein
MGIWNQLWPFTDEEAGYELPERSLEDLKQMTNILFIDDNEDFQVVDILRQSGWINTSAINDVKSLDSPEIRNAHIIFVDIHGVGVHLDFEDEGLGLITALKDKYPQKFVVVYSAQSTGDRFHEGITQSDDALAKNADPYQFQAVVEDFSKDIFTVNRVVSRLQNEIEKFHGRRMPKDQIERKIKSLASGNGLSDQKVKSVFGLNKTGNIASIISLFLS